MLTVVTFTSMEGMCALPDIVGSVHECAWEDVVLKRHFLQTQLTNLPGQCLQCQANGSNVCRDGAIGFNVCRVLRLVITPPEAASTFLLLWDAVTSTIQGSLAHKTPPPRGNLQQPYT